MGGEAVLVAVWQAGKSVPQMAEVVEAPTDLVEMQMDMAEVAVGGAT